MNNFKEWLSDYLRYFILGFIIILIIAAAILGINIYSKAVKGNDKKPEGNVQVIESTEEDQKNTEKTTEPETKARQTESETEMKQTESESETQTESETAVQTEPETEPLTEAVPETEPEPVYITMQGSCYLRADASMEADIIGEYWAGTTVQFLEDVGGWYKVQIDGMTGYMGARFF